MNLLDQLARTTGAAAPQPGSAPSGPDSGTPAVCSRKACRADAAWRLLWNNPRIHTPERRKTWLACDEHRGWLEEYLQTRDLWKETLPLDGAAASGDTATSGDTAASGDSALGNSASGNSDGGTA